MDSETAKRLVRREFRQRFVAWKDKHGYSGHPGYQIREMDDEVVSVDMVYEEYKRDPNPLDVELLVNEVAEMTEIGCLSGLIFNSIVLGVYKEDSEIEPVTNLEIDVRHWFVITFHYKEPLVKE